MTDQKHTPYPEITEGAVTIVATIADADRMFACKKALEGIDDPVAFMRDVRGSYNLNITRDERTSFIDRVIAHLKGGDE